MLGRITRVRSSAITALAILGLPAGAAALFVSLEVRQVPIARLLANLEAARAAEPGNAQHEINIARLYGMAYTLGSDHVPAVRARDDRDEPWYGYEPKLVPYASEPGKQPAGDPGGYLKTSLEHYRAALALAPDDPLARLGYGWTLAQSGQRAAAIAEYRRVIREKWPEEERASRALFRPFYTAEAAGYLIPLLDPRDDAAEIADLDARRARLQQLPRPITPIVVPLIDTADPATLVDRTARVRFDADGSGEPRDWTWITGDAGWLVFDADGSGRIGSAVQWFGNVTFWLFWSHGYDALAALDDDRNGELAGREVRGLAIWRDANRNGVSDAGEVRPLAEYGILGVSCRFVLGDRAAGVAAMSSDGVRFVDGRHRPTFDVMLEPHGPRRITTE